MSKEQAAFTTVGIVGRGIVGSSWALVFARAGLNVRIWCRKPEEVGGVRQQVADAVAALNGTGLGGDPDTIGRITVCTSLEETLRDADYVQESVSEDLDLKLNILHEIEAVVHRTTVIGSSTSGLLPSVLSQDMAHPERFLIVHPLTPPHLLPITELCASAHTSHAVTVRVSDYLTRIGQRPVVLHAEIPGFALNRVLGAMMNECFALVNDGVLDPHDIDALLTEGFGLRWGVIGPLAAMDLNAPDGIGDYLRRYGEMYNEVARSRGATPVLTDNVIDSIDATLSVPCSEEERHARKHQRDRRVAKLRAARDAILNETSMLGTVTEPE